MKLYVFPSAFAWEHPLASPSMLSPDVLQPPRTAGVLLSLPFPESNLVTNLRRVAEMVSLPSEEYDCLSGGKGRSHCTNPFFEGLAKVRVMGFAGRSWSITDYSFVISSLAVFLALSTLAKDWIIRHKPYWMRCRCWFMKSFCPCPKGTREQIEKLDDHFWDRLRLFYYGMSALYFLMAAIYPAMRVQTIMLDLWWVQEAMPKGTSIRPVKGTRFAAITWGNVLVSIVAFALMWARRYITTRPTVWGDARALDDSRGRAHVALDKEKA